MRAWLLVMAACGPGLAVGTKQTARDALTNGNFDQLVRGDVTNGGLWFQDASCAAKFATPGKIAKADVAAFAHCLAGLQLQPNAREDALPDVVVMTYGPGIEVEVRVVFDDAGPRVTWIGFEARRSDADNLPTISSEALEALRLEGDRDGPLEPAVASTFDRHPELGIYTWIKVCLDEYGAVTDAHPFETTSVGAREAFRLAVLAWRFKPFMLAGTATPVCAMTRLESPPRSGHRPEVLPLPLAPASNDPTVFMAPRALEGRRISGVRTVVPDDDTKELILRSGKRAVAGVFRFCIDPTGHVDALLPARSTGFASYDNRILAAIKGWVYKPYEANGKAVRVCTAVTFVYRQQSGRMR